jgi:hypothetical protein
VEVEGVERKKRKKKKKKQRKCKLRQLRVFSRIINNAGHAIRKHLSSLEIRRASALARAAVK